LWRTRLDSTTVVIKTQVGFVSLLQKQISITTQTNIYILKKIIKKEKVLHVSGASEDGENKVVSLDIHL